ncbi:hypothetical protein GGI15_001844 [Coemansia interrupta]|uniref:HD/PDEase domain-containing protein n=1 Tax=Coemansia interrupta TaxID=1126814 RepID=A0A9W8HIA4_9FUNG|nr:hypothetical protein GGI15_001844 [Coemansia interrupta]
MDRHRSMLRRGFSHGTDSDIYSNTKYVNDPIHGYIDLSKTILQFVDTPQFQRLRHLKQLGSSYYVFPGASNNRFEHCIGTSHLASQVLQGLSQRQPELGITERDFRCVALAGLCHDLGHGPFSHVFDNEFIPRVCDNTSWSHEEGSEMMLHYAIDDNSIDIDEDDVTFIKRLIRGSRTGTGDEKLFLFDIVANQRNGVDVDKFDYIQRDCYNVGVKSSYDFSRLMLNSRVIDDQICYNHKEAYNLAEMFHTRYSLHKRVYSHRAAKAIEFMLVDAMTIANPVLRISDAIHDPRQYQNLTDEVIRDIERSREPELQEARNIIKRINTRDIYRFVDEFIIPPDLVSVVTSSTITEAAIVGFRADGDDFSEADILIDFCRIHYGMRSENPVDHINFFSKYKPDEKFSIPSEIISLCMPQKYEECIVRIFTRSPTKRKQIQQAVRKMVAKLSSRIMGADEDGISSLSIAASPSNITPNRGLTLPDDTEDSILKRRRLDFGHV